MNDTKENQQTIFEIRRLLAEQQERREQLAQLTFNERGHYCAQAVTNALAARVTEPRPVCLEDIQFAAQFTGFCTGEILTLEEMCGILFDHADYFIDNGFYTSENIDSLYRAYHARLN